MRLIDADVLIRDYVYDLDNNYVADLDDIQNMPTIDAVPHWIPCKEKMPNMTEKFFLVSGYVGVGVGWWNGSEFLSSTLLPHDEVIAWMPLPKPYVERKNK